jgi:hypothetical protein
VQPPLNGTRQKRHFVRERMYQGTHASMEALAHNLRTRVLALLSQQRMSEHVNASTRTRTRGAGPGGHCPSPAHPCARFAVPAAHE